MEPLTADLRCQGSDKALLRLYWGSIGVKALLRLQLSVSYVQVEQLTADLTKAIEQQDFAKAAQLKQLLKDLLED